METIDVWTRNKGWKVNPITVSRFDLGELGADDQVKFELSGGGLEVTHAVANSRWNGMHCDFGPDKWSVTGTLDKPDQRFSIKLVDRGGFKLVGRVFSLEPEDPDLLPPAGGNWTAQEGS